MTTTDNIRTIIAFLGSEANAEHVSKFLPETVLAAETKMDKALAATELATAALVEAKATIAALEARPAAPAQPTVVRGEQTYTFVAGIGYVPARNVRLNSLGELLSVHGIVMGGEYKYEEGKITCVDAKEGTKTFVDFTPLGDCMCVSKIVSMAPGVTTTHIIDNAGVTVKTTRVHADYASKEIYVAGKIVRSIYSSGNVKNVDDYTTVPKTVSTIIRLHPNVRRIVASTESSYELRTPKGRFVFTDHTDQVTGGDGKVSGNLSIKGSIYKFRIGNTVEIYRWADSRLEYQKTMQRGSIQAGDLTVKVETEVPESADPLDNVAQ